MIQLTDTTWQSDNGLITFIHGDCMDFMTGCKENEFQLSCVDPPYGIGHSLLSGEKRGSKFIRTIKHVEWDIMPTKEYFIELFRISKNQIIWGGNYFINELSNTKCFLMWDKIQTFSGSDFELAWTSFDKPSKSFRMSRVEAYSNGKIHPTEKPIELYRWIFKNYAKPTDHILDTHGGSFSIAIAAHMEGLRMTIIELDTEYFHKAITRFANYEAQQTIKFD